MGCIFAHHAMRAGARRIDWSPSPRSSSFEEVRLRGTPGITRTEHNESALPQAADVRDDVAGGLRRATTRRNGQQLGIARKIQQNRSVGP